MDMQLERLQDLSIYYWLVGLFAVYPQVTVVDGYTTADVNLPSVTVTDGPIDYIPFQHGSRVHKRSRVWMIDIATNNKAQRTEFSSYIVSNLENGISVYDYNEGFPPTPVTQIGTIRARDIDVRPIRIFPELSESKMYWRGTIVFFDDYVPE